MKKLPSIRKLLTMLVEWHETADTLSDMQKWWDKYPAFSCNDVVKLARKKLNQTK